MGWGCAGSLMWHIRATLGGYGVGTHRLRTVCEWGPGFEGVGLTWVTMGRDVAGRRRLGTVGEGGGELGGCWAHLGSRWAVTWHATIPASLSLADKLVVAPTSLNEGRGEGDGAAYPRCPRRCSQCGAGR